MLKTKRTTEAMISEARFPEGEYPEKALTEKIIGCAIQVHRTLGPGYLEAIYENALALELRKQGLAFERQVVAPVLYSGVKVGEHRADLIVEGRAVVELKSVEELTETHAAQVISTLKAAKMEVGLLINFRSARLVEGVRRIVLTR